MEKRISYTLSRKSVLTWLISLIFLASAACCTAFYCDWKGADNTTVWRLLILPASSGLLFCAVLLLGGKEHLYRASVPAVLWCAAVALRLQNAGFLFPYAILRVLPWAIMLAVFLVFHMTFCGKLHSRWMLALLLLVTLGTELIVCRRCLAADSPASFLSALSFALLTLGMLLTTVCMTPHLDDRYHPTWGDRPDGRRVRSLPPITYVAPYIMPNRNGAANHICCAFDIDAVEKYIHAKRREGLTNFGITHVFLATYVRCCARFPALNRFMSGQHIYSRGDDIQFSMIVKKDMTVDAPDTAIKLHLTPADDANSIYRKFNEAVEEVKNAPLDSSFDQAAHALNLIPGVILKFVLWLLKTMDYFGLLPGFLLELSPFHGSVFFTSMGSLGIPAIVHHLYDFGNLPAFVAFGCKRHVNELQADGTIVTKKYVDAAFNLDERTVDGFYYATVLKYFQRIIRHPEQLDAPPESIVRDVQ